MANAMCGETEITLNGKFYTLRPTFHAIANIEHDTSKGVIALAKAIHDNSITLRDMAIVVRYCAISDGPLDVDEIGRGILRLGVANVMPVLSVVFTHILGGADASA